MFDDDKIWSSTQLPSLPAVAVRLLELSRDPETEISQIVALIKTDPAISARILKATNSAFFSFRSRVTSIDRAVPLLGSTVVTSLALSFSLAESSIATGPMQTFFRDYWRQSIVHAVAGETLGKRCEKGLDCEFFLAGLMVDIGRLAMLKAISREYYPVLITATSQERQLFEVELEFLGIDHAMVGYKLMHDWGLPDAILRGVRLQHFTLETLQQELDPEQDMLEAAMVLSNAVGDYFLSSTPGVAIQRIRDLARQFFNMDNAETDTFLKEVRTRVDQAADLFAVDMSDIQDPTELMSLANQQLLELTMRARSETIQASEREKQIEREKKMLESKNLELEKRATHDKLTGVFNRGYFDDAIKASIKESCERSCPAAVIFADIDKFKTLNDTYGHKFGDEVLQQFADVVQGSLRSADILCRYGGEEFVIIVYRPSEKGLEKLAERIRQNVEQMQVHYEGKRVPVTSSFGCAIALPGRGELNCTEQLLLKADEALYEAKESGRNRVCHRNLMDPADRQLLKAVNQNKFSRWLVTKEILDIPTISRILLQVPPDQRCLGLLAVHHKILKTAEVDNLVEIQSENQYRRFGDLAVEHGFLTNDQLYLILSWQIEPPDRVMNSMVANNLFSAERCQELYEQYLRETVPAEFIPA